MTIPHELAEQALKLPLEDRRTLAHMLEASLPQADVTLSKEWLDEIDRRLESVDRGEVVTIDRVTAMNEIREQLAQRRAARQPS